jgi:uncharacterized OsmC-like protein
MDLGFSPVDLILSAISICKITTGRNLCSRKGWTIGNVDAKLSQVVRRNKEGTLSTTVESKINIERDITEGQRV